MCLSMIESAVIFSQISCRDIVNFRKTFDQYIQAHNKYFATFFNYAYSKNKHLYMTKETLCHLISSHFCYKGKVVLGFFFFYTTNSD